MDPVRKPNQNSRRTLLLLAGLIIFILGTFFWQQHVREPERTPITAMELDSRLMEPDLAAVKQPVSPKEQKLREAQAALADRQAGRALQLADELLVADANHVAAYIVKGQAYRRMNELTKAAAAFSKAAQLQPELADSYLYRGHVHKAGKQYEQATADYNRALERNPDLVAAYYHRGDVYLVLEKFDAAMAEFSTAIEKQAGLEKQLPTPYFKRGYLLYVQNQYKDAVRDLSRAIELAPNMYEAYLYRANALCALGRFDMALRDYNELIKLKPDLSLGYFGRALVLRAKGDTVKAEADFRKAEQMGIKRLQ